MLRARVAGFIEDLVRGFGRKPFIPEVNGESGALAEGRGKGAGAGRLRTLRAIHVQGKANHDSGHLEPAAEPRQGARVLMAAVAALQRENGLGGEAEAVRDSHANAAVADVEPEIARLRLQDCCSFPFVADGRLFRLRKTGTAGLPAAGDSRAWELLPLQSKERESPEGFYASVMADTRRVADQRMASRKRKSIKKKKAPLGSLFTAFFLLALLAAGWVAWQWAVPYGPGTETFVDLAPGSSSLQIGRQLEEAGVVRSQFAFDLMRAWKRGTLRAGEYRFDHPATVAEVYGRIARGDVFTVAVTVPEGANIFDIAGRLQQAGLTTRQDFLDAATQQVGLIADLDPGATNLEGYLFPDTYRFARRTSAKEIAATMVHRFRAVAAELGLKQNVHRVVTIASLVERETAVDSERPLVASVFENRLAQNMPLMTDPSVIYAALLDGRYRGTIYESDLQADSAYNTYRHQGLPPGPICNPGLKSLEAAMHPATTNYLYFVAAGADPSGKSRFSATLQEHAKDVEAYRRAVHQADQPQ